MDPEKAKALKPKLEALKAFLRSVASLGPYLPDNRTRQNYREMYDHIKLLLDDPDLETYAPPLPHLGTVMVDSGLWSEHQARLVESGTRLVSYLESQLAQAGLPRPSGAQPFRCFLSYRFSEHADKYARELKGFLKTLGIEVVTGERFEPRSISQKVRELLSGDLHFGVLLVTTEGESMWTRDEVNALRSEGKYVIVLVEQGAAFAPGLQADLEWIPFSPGHVSDAFTKLLQGIQFIRTIRP
jgi:hypothetical protein